MEFTQSGSDGTISRGDAGRVGSVAGSAVLDGPHANRTNPAAAAHAGAASRLTAVPSPSGSPAAAKDQQVWRVQCGDVINRDRCLTVLVEDGNVVLVGPPGETARLSAGQLGELRHALNEAWEASKGARNDRKVNDQPEWR